MASGMKHWLALVGVGFALAAIWALPPGVLELTERPARPHETLRYDALSRDLSSANETLKRMRWVDSLSALAVRPATEGITVVAPPPVSPGHLEELGRLFKEIEASIEPRYEGMRLLYAFQDIRHGHDPAVRSDERGRTETYAGRRDGIDYCLRVVVSSAPPLTLRNQLEALRDRPTWATGLGACRLFAAYGPPGPAIREWLERGGSVYAARDAMPVLDGATAIRWGRRLLFGTSTVSGGRTLVLERCLAGSEDACGAVFLEPALGAPALEPEGRLAQRASAISVRERSNTLLGEGSYLLADLEADRGTDAFRRFWTSDSDVRSAFEEAFGLTPGAWVVSWVDSVIGVDPPGPRLAGSGSTLPVVLTLGLFATIAILQARRRRAA